MLAEINQSTMSSREIAERTGKQHSNVCRDIRTMLSDLGEAKFKFEFSYSIGNGRNYTEYRLPKDLCLTLVSGYSIPLRHKIITRWQELEAQAVTEAIPDFSNPAEAARAWADQYETRLIAEEKVRELEPAARVGSIAVSKSRTLNEVARRLPGVNQNRVKADLVDMGYLWRAGGAGNCKAYAKHRHLFEERYTNDQGYAGPIVCTSEGQELLVDLYQRGKLTMRKGQRPQEFDLSEFMA